jgi:membrane protein
VDENPDRPARPSRVAALRARYRWLDHLARAGESYTGNHGDHYAAAVTYFSVLAVVPLLMVAFAVAAFALRHDQALLRQVQDRIDAAAPRGMGDTLRTVVSQAITSGGTVGVGGLLGARYSGLGWMTNLREALSAQWGQRSVAPTLPRRLVVDLLALLGLGAAVTLSMAVASAGGLIRPILRFVGLADVAGLTPLVRLLVVLVGLSANALVLLWVIARLPREPVTWRSAAKAAVGGAVGLEIIKQVLVVYVVTITDSPAGAAFGPIIGLLIFVFTVSRFILFLAAWAATARENMIEEPPPAPAPAPAPAVARRATFDVAHEFERTVQGQTTGFGVQLAAARSTLKIGRDELAFDVRPERDGYLYVFAFGADGALYQLVPNAVSGAVRVQAGRSFHFPTGNGIVVNASEPPGPGALMVLVSALQRDHSALAPTRDGPFRVFAVGAAGAAGLARAAGPQPPLAGRPVCPTAGACDDAYGAAQARIDTVR